jgi:periplasmic mercuric ion binding protein
MKKLKLLLLSLTLAFVTFSAQAQKSKKEQSVDIKTSAVCGMCKASIEKAISNEKGVKNYSLDVDSKILTVVYDTRKTNVSTLKQTVTATGYDADELPAQEKAYNKLSSCCKKGSASN